MPGSRGDKGQSQKDAKKKPGKSIKDRRKEKREKKQDGKLSLGS
jgi:hypothetical protein